MPTNIQATYAALNSHYLNTATMRINKDYLNDALQIAMDNDRDLYKAKCDDKVSPRVVLWNTLLYLTDSCIEYEELPNLNTPYKATSPQVKKWLFEYGDGYDTIAPMIEYVVEERKRMEMENARELFDGRKYLKLYATNDINGNKIAKEFFVDGTVEYVKDARLTLTSDKFYRTLSGLRASRLV